MICYDANVILEVLFDRSNAKACKALLERSNEQLVTTLISVSIVMYFAEAKKADTAYTERFLRQFIWLPVTESDAQWAFLNYKAKDFEDALQIACATRENCKRFATLDKSLAKKYASDIKIDLIT